ncbi:MAG: hypothetical protein ABSE19_12745 [Candidatus Acidiferrum sp.]|jgi:hypothetical protein
MTDRYLFRLDGSHDNDEFFTLYSSSDCRVTYSGTPLKIGPGWIPDFLEIKVDNGGRDLAAILIELEAIRITALESSRKYLPEDPAAVIQAVIAYLGTVIAQCRGTADPRLPEVEKLLGRFSSAERILVSTAAGFRDSADLIEVLPLINQQTSPQPRGTTAPVREAQNFHLMGRRTLSREEANGLRRTIKILDAVVTGRDESGATYHSWLNLRVKPLHRSVTQQSSATPELHRLLSKPNDKGIQLDLDRLLEDVLSVWSQSPHLRPSKNQIATSIEEYLPLARSIRSHTPMRDVFRQARNILEKQTH